MLRRSSFPMRYVAMGVVITSVLIGLSATASTAKPEADSATPIKHLVVIFQENVSFDHYFGTYPNAANTSGQTFTAAPGTPSVDGLSGSLLTANPNGANPRRYDPSNVQDVLTCDQDHNYNDEQRVFDNGAMDRFPQTVGNGTGTSPEGQACVAGDVMNYYDGNTVTALWNYAQQYAMNDNSFGTTFGPSSPGAVNLVSGNTGNVDMSHTANSPSTASREPERRSDRRWAGWLQPDRDAQPYWDDCSTCDAVAMQGKNIGDLLNEASLSWGFFQGGFRATTSFADAASASSHAATDVDVHPRRVQERRLQRLGPALVEPGHLQRRSRSRCGLPCPDGHRSVRLQGRLHPAPPAVPVLRVHREPAPRHPADEQRRHRCGLCVADHRYRHAALRERAAAVRHAEPPVRHERLRSARGGNRHGDLPASHFPR